MRSSISWMKSGSPIPGTEKDIKAILCAWQWAFPLVELFFQAGCEMKFVPELGAMSRLWTTAAAPAWGLSMPPAMPAVEEASSAMLTGKIAGLSAANDLAAVDGFEEKFADYQGQLQMLRQGPGGAKDPQRR